MERARVARGFGGLNAVAIASLVGLFGCGSVSDVSGPSDAGQGNAGRSGEAGDSSLGQGGHAGRAGAAGVAGNSGPAGAANLGGSSNGGSSNGGFSNGGSSNGGSVSSGAGNSGCLEGVPCTCKDLVGVTSCNAKGVSSCSCPPANQCEPAAPDAPCFEPCGGEPFGAWVLEDACFSGRSSDGTCQRALSGKSGDSRVRLQLLDGGWGQVYGQEDWDISSNLALSCLGLKSVNDCEQTHYLSEALLFSYSPPIACAANACGTCDCDAHLDETISARSFNWTRDANLLSFGSSISSANYCVQGDELWFGNTTGSGNSKVSYKFKKMSCTGVPVACTDRTPAQCTMGSSCVIGRCKSTGSTGTHCAQADNQSGCNVLEGCGWDANGCSARTNADPPVCNFASCDTEPGCSWGPPLAKCAGYAGACSDVPLDQCTGHGCSVVNCQPNGELQVDCAQITNKTDCAKAVGCVVNSGAGAPCSGQTTCLAQTDASVCGKLNCYGGPSCYGELDQCPSLTVATCHDVPGCSIEW